jgi:hypothetical protein
MVDNNPAIIVSEKLQVIFLCKIGLLIHSNVRCQDLCIYENVDNEIRLNKFNRLHAIGWNELYQMFVFL